MATWDSGLGKNSQATGRGGALELPREAKEGVYPPQRGCWGGLMTEEKHS